MDKPVVGIAYTASDFNNCHRHFPELLAAVKRGVLTAGALPLEFPTISLGEVFLTPTSLKYRNLMAMDTEEMIRAQPMDAVVLMGGCDKTVPAQLMGAVSADRPAIALVAGPMMTGRYRGERLGACTDCRRFWARYRAGDIDAEEISEVEGQLAVTAGTCAVMGTASTMACLTEALGLCLPGTAAIPAVHADRLRAAEATGAAAVKLIGTTLTPSQLINKNSVENALRVLLALGGSTNAVIHLTAIAGRAGVKVSLDQPQHAVGYDAGPGQSQAGRQRLHGRLLRRRRHGRAAARIKAAAASRLHDGDRRNAGRAARRRRRRLSSTARSSPTATKPLEPEGGLVALFGNLAPQGAILKRSAADPKLFEHEGRAVVFSSLEDLAARIDDPEARRRGRRHSGVAECRTACAGLHAGGRLSADSEEARAQGREGYGPHFRRAHERHRLRHHRAACDAGRRVRRSARAGQDRRPHPAVGEERAASSSWSTMPS